MIYHRLYQRSEHVGDPRCPGAYGSLRPRRHAVVAQSNPTKPVRNRASCPAVTERWHARYATADGFLGRTVIVENRPAGAGQIGMDFVAKAAPDGYTLMVNSDAAFVVNPHLYSKLPYDSSPISSRSAGSVSPRRPWCCIPRRRPIRSRS